MSTQVTAINGMGSAVVTGTNVATTGLEDLDIMHFANDFLIAPSVVDAQAESLKVQANGTPNNTVIIKKGTGYVLNSSYSFGTNEYTKYYKATFDADETVTIPATSANPRKDIICLKIDKLTTPNSEATNIASIVVVTGTEAASPSAPATPNDHLLLAEISVANPYSSTTNSDITDKRNPTIIAPTFPMDGGTQNLRISKSISSNQLVVSILTADGNTPSSNNPVWARIFGNLRKITSSLSITVPNGTNYFASGSSVIGANDVDYFVYLGYRAASDTVFLLISRFPWARTYADFSGTTTNEKYGFFSGSTPASTDRVINIGRTNATLSTSGTSHIWSNATDITIQRPVFESRTLTFTGVTTGFSGALSFEAWRYQIGMHNMTLRILALGTSSTTALTWQLPFNTNAAIYQTCRVQDNSSIQTSPGLLEIFSGTASVNAYKTMASGAWTGSGTKGIYETQFTAPIN